VSVSTSQPPTVRQPLGVTFIVAIGVLAAFALLQIVAVGVYYYPFVRDQLTQSALRMQETPSAVPAEAQQTPPPAAQPGNAAPAAPVLSAQDQAKVNRLFADAQKNLHIGQFDVALKSISAAETITPGNSSVLLMKGAILEQMGQIDGAIVAIEDALKDPMLSPDYRPKAEGKLQQLYKMAAAAPKPQDTPAAGSTTAVAPEGVDSAMRDESGFQPGSNLAIVDSRVREGKKPGTQSLLVGIKARQGSNINSQDVQVQVYIYEQGQDGEASLQKCSIHPQWLSAPLDWADDQPEVLDVQFSPLPRPDGSAPGKYYGYVVGVYYNNGLQDFRSDPAKLAKDFPIPLYLKKDSDENTDR